MIIISFEIIAKRQSILGSDYDYLIKVCLRKNLKESLKDLERKPARVFDREQRKTLLELLSEPKQKELRFHSSLVHSHDV